MRQIFIIFLSLLFFQSLHSKEKTTENLLKDIIKIQEKISKLKKPKNEEALKIDLTLKERNKLVDHSIKNVKNNNLELAISALNAVEVCNAVDFHNDPPNFTTSLILYCVFVSQSIL